MKLVLVFLVLQLCEFGNGSRAAKRPNLSDSVEYFTKRNQPININITFHMDPALTTKLTKETRYNTRQKLKAMSHKVLKDVERFFQHRSLNQTIRFTLINTRFFKNMSNVVRMDEDASRYLKSYCTWQGRKKIAKRAWHYSVLLTGLDLYYVNGRGEKVRRSTGRGYMSSMCTMMKSCTLIEWHPKNIGFLLAHEIAHSLSINHDGPPSNHCSDNLMMGSKYSAQHHPDTWSECSRQYLKQFLKSGKSWCIRPDIQQ